MTNKFEYRDGLEYIELCQQRDAALAEAKSLRGDIDAHKTQVASHLRTIASTEALRQEALQYGKEQRVEVERFRAIVELQCVDNCKQAHEVEHHRDTLRRAYSSQSWDEALTVIRQREPDIVADCVHGPSLPTRGAV